MSESLLDRCRDLWNRTRRSPARPPICVSIPADRVQQDRPPGGVFERDQHYFQIRVNELFLASGREWYRTYDPLVVVLAEFQYGRSVEAVPTIVGPNMLEKSGVTELPVGMVFHDTRVAGLHPYRGGRLNLSVILCRLARKDHVRQLLATLEGAAAAFDVSTALGSYLKLGRVVIDGVDQLLGHDGSDPLAGMRREFDPDAGQPFREGYHVIIHAPEGSLDPGHLWVLNGRLHIAAPGGPAVPFRAADYVLYSVVGTGARTDLSILPFYEQWERVKHEAAKPGEEAWKSAKANMLALYQQMATSPDLTPAHARALLQQFKAEMQAIHDSAMEIVSFDTRAGEPDGLDPTLWRESVDLLDL